MEHLRPFISLKCRQTEVSIKARYLHRAFICYLEEHNENPIDRRTFLEWMSQVAPEFTYDSKNRIFHGLELQSGKPSKKRSSGCDGQFELVTSDGYSYMMEDDIDEKRRKSPLIVPADNTFDNEVLTVDPLMFIDRTSMPPIQDPILTKEVYLDYRKWNLSERNRLNELEKLTSNPDIKHTITGLEATLDRELQIIQNRYEHSHVNPNQAPSGPRIRLRTPRVRREGSRTRRGILSDRTGPASLHNQRGNSQRNEGVNMRTSNDVNNRGESFQGYYTSNVLDNQETTPLLHSEINEIETPNDEDPLPPTPPLSPNPRR